MKKIMLPILTLLIIASCGKKTNVPENTTTIDVMLAEGESYEHNLGTRSSTSAEITRQPMHASVNRIPIAPTSTATIYEYAPETDFTGTDSVMIDVTTNMKSKCGSQHSSESRSTCKLRFKIGG
jgi:hypothetical protein